MFYLEKRPTTIRDEQLFNVQVRGKRGNIVQTYPAVEYDFFPTNLRMSTRDLVHFQWTGELSVFFIIKTCIMLLQFKAIPWVVSLNSSLKLHKKEVTMNIYILLLTRQKMKSPKKFEISKKFFYNRYHTQTNFQILHLYYYVISVKLSKGLSYTSKINQ